jgi:hypothetical protein
MDSVLSERRSPVNRGAQFSTGLLILRCVLDNHARQTARRQKVSLATISLPDQDSSRTTIAEPVDQCF